MTEKPEKPLELTSDAYAPAFNEIATEVNKLVEFNSLNLENNPGAQFAPTAWLRMSGIGSEDAGTLKEHFTIRAGDQIVGYRITDPDDVFGDKTGWRKVREAINRLNATERMKRFNVSARVDISQEFEGFDGFGAISVALHFQPREPAY